MTPLIDFTNPITTLLAVIVFVLVILLGKETKKSTLTAVMLFIFLAVIAGHSVEYFIIKDPTGIITSTLIKCITVDFAFIFISFLSYLWIDEIEAKANKTKSISNSLSWFWSKV